MGGSNFGCGSSREHAPQTIRRSGIKAVIAESFAEIFFGNSTGIGLPCVCASAADIAALARHISDHPETEVTIDLLNMTASWKEGSFPIRMPAEAREALTRGRWDSIAELLVNMDAVEKKTRNCPRSQPPADSAFTSFLPFYPPSPYDFQNYRLRPLRHAGQP